MRLTGKKHLLASNVRKTATTSTGYWFDQLKTFSGSSYFIGQWWGSYKYACRNIGFCTQTNRLLKCECNRAANQVEPYFTRASPTILLCIWQRGYFGNLSICTVFWSILYCLPHIMAPFTSAIRQYVQCFDRFCTACHTWWLHLCANSSLFRWWQLEKKQYCHQNWAA